MRVDRVDGVGAFDFFDPFQIAVSLTPLIRFLYHSWGRRLNLRF